MNKMVLNPKKTKNIIFNFSKKNQFSTNIKLKGEKLDTVEETKLLGTIITSDLKWKRNTEEIVKDANKRMRILHAAAKYRYFKNKTEVTSECQKFMNLYERKINSVIKVKKKTIV